MYIKKKTERNRISSKYKANDKQLVLHINISKQNVRTLQSLLQNHNTYTSQKSSSSVT